MIKCIQDWVKTFYYLLELKGIMSHLEIKLYRVANGLALDTERFHSFTWDQGILEVNLSKPQFLYLAMLKEL